MGTIQLEFSVVPDHPKAITEPLVALGDFEARHAGAVVYKSHTGASMVSSLWGDLILGRPLPTKLILRKVESVEQLLCLALFMDRELALHPKVPTLVSAVELVKSLGPVGLAHIEPDLARLLIFLDSYVFGGNPNRKELSRRLQQSLGWVRDYALENRLPSLPRQSDPPKVLDRGTNGFVVAEARKGKFFEALIDVYRMGFLRGLLFSPEGEGPYCAMAFKKSAFLQFDLQTAVSKLNQAESQVGRPASWVLEERLLYNESTLMPRDLVLQVLLRV